MPFNHLQKFYYVDEAGDGNIFDKKGRVLIGQEGCSKYFILGVLDFNNMEILANELSELHRNLLMDPYFSKVPSMLPSNRKTYYFFHATDDLPEVRREVFSVIRKYDPRFMAVVRNKARVLDYIQRRTKQDAYYHYHPNELYDFMVRILFKNLLHKEDEYHITFSNRGKQDRTRYLKAALMRTQHRYVQQTQTANASILNVYPKNSRNCIPLQVVDYFLWSLQRFYEKHEDRYLNYVWPSIKLVHDLDDNRKTDYGFYYTQKKPLTLAALDDNSPGI